MRIYILNKELQKKKKVDSVWFSQKMWFLNIFTIDTLCLKSYILDNVMFSKMRKCEFSRLFFKSYIVDNRQACSCGTSFKYA